MKIGHIAEKVEKPVVPIRRFVISVSDIAHQWLKAEAARRNVTLQMVTEEAYYAYRHVVKESVGIDGED